MAGAVGTGRLPAGAAPRGFDPATPLGLIGGVALIMVAVSTGGDPRAFVNLPAALIVLGGTLAVTTVSFALADVLATPAVLVKALGGRREAVHEAALDLLRLAGLARKDGPLALGGRLARHADRPLLQRGLGLVIDGAAPQEVEPILRRGAGRHAGAVPAGARGAAARGGGGPGDGADRHAGRAGADARPAGGPGADRSGHGGGAAHHPLRRPKSTKFPLKDKDAVIFRGGGPIGCADDRALIYLEH
jgi:hypothetical protein